MAGERAVWVQDENGRKVAVSPDVARDGFLKGAYKPTESKVRVGRGDQTATVDAADIQSAIDAGWDPISEVQAADAQLRREESGVLGQARGTAEAFASGLTFGASDLVLSGGGSLSTFGGATRESDTEARQRFAARNKAAGSLGDAARLAGEVLPTVISGGGSLGVKGAATGAKLGLGQTAKQGTRQAIRGLGILPRGVEAVGLAAERGATRLLGTGLRGRTAGAFARGSIEGAAGAMGEEIHESVIGGRDITAERLLAAAKMGGLFGGGASAAFPLTGALLKRGAKAPKDAVQAVLGKVAKADPENMGPAAEWVETVTSGRAFEPIKKQAGLFKTKEGRKLAYDALHNADEVTAKAAKVAKEETTALAEAVRSVVQKTEADRTANMRRLLGGVDDDVAASHTRSALERVYHDINGPDGLERIAKYSGNAPMHKWHLDDAIGAVEEAWDDIVEKGLDGASAHQRLLKTKRRLQEIAKKAGASDSVALETRNFIRRQVSTIDTALGDDMFGDAAKAFTEMRDADRLALQASEKLFKTSRVTGAREGKNLLGRILNGDATDADVMTFTKRVGNPKFADQADLADDYFERQIKAAEVRAKHSDDAALRQEVEKLRKSQAKFRKTMQQQARVADIIDANRASGRGGLTGALAAFGPSGAAVSGALLGGIPGMVVGAAVNAAARPAQSIRTLAAVAHLADKAGLDVDSIVARVTGAAPKAVEKASKAAKAAPGVAGRAGERVGKVARGARGIASRAASRAAVSRSEDQRAKQRRAEELADPDTLTRELAQQMYALTDAAPGIAGSAAEKVGVAAAFLADKLPPEISDPVTGRKRIIDPATRDAFDRYHEAVTDPVATLGRLEDGTMTLEHAEALREVWPALYEDVQGKVFEGLQAAADEGREVPYTRRKSLGILFDLPTVPEMTPEYRQAVEALIGGEMEAENARAEMEANAKEDGAQAKLARKTDFKSPKRYGMTLSRIERNDV